MARSSSSRPVAAVQLLVAISALCAALSSATVTTVNEPIVNGLSWSFYDVSSLPETVALSCVTGIQ